MINIILVDDHKLFRMTLKMALSESPDFTISGETDSGTALFAMLKTITCDLVLLDINMPEMSGIEIAHRLRREYPAVKILVISNEDTKDTVSALLEEGVDGFVSKQMGSVDEITHAIHSILDGYEYYGSDISTLIYQIYISKKKNITETPEFSPREKEIIELCSNGFIAKEIADKLNISVNTVHNHKNNIFQKLNINNTMEMVQYALKHKIIRM